MNATNLDINTAIGTLFVHFVNEGSRLSVLLDALRPLLETEAADVAAVVGLVAVDAEGEAAGANRHHLCLSLRQTPALRTGTVKLEKKAFLVHALKFLFRFSY